MTTSRSDIPKLKAQKPKIPRGLYAITDTALSPGKSVLTHTESALRGGCQIIQYRDKTASEVELLRNAQSLRQLCAEYNAKFIINDNLDLCLRTNADGVHLGKSDGNIRVARKKLGDEKILGVTCHSDIAYAQLAIQQGVDYCAFGRIFPSKTKPNAPHCTINILREATKLAIPIVAIGGISLENIQSLIDTNIHSVAVIQGLFGQENIEKTAHDFSHFFKH